MTRHVVAGLACLSLLIASPARAALVTWHLSGTVVVNLPSDTLTSLGVVSGAPLSATITLESSTPASNPSDPPLAGCCGYYAGAVREVTFEVGLYSVTLPSNRLAYSTISAPFGATSLSLVASAELSDDLLSLQSPKLALDLVNLGSPNGTSLPALPPISDGTQLSLALFTINHFGATLSAYGFSLSPTVPEASPGVVLALLGAGLAARSLRSRASRPGGARARSPRRAGACRGSGPGPSSR